MLLVVSLLVHASVHGDELRREASWRIPTLDEMTALLVSGLNQQGLEAGMVERVASDFRKRIIAGETDHLDAFVSSVALSVPTVAEIIKKVGTQPTSLASDAFLTLADTIRPSVAVWAARALVHAKHYDEAIPLLQSIDPNSTVDPAGTLFFRAVCAHALINKELAISDIEKLLENEPVLPIRYRRTAQLMLADIKPLKQDSLDEISRMMSDVSRRLELGRTGEPVETKEQEIIDKLSKLIDQIEQQQQQQQQQMMQQSGGGQSQGGGQQPMNDSQIAGTKGAGDVDKKDLGDRDGWGNLPPAERQEALQQISRDLPTHYREAIEAYFRKMAIEAK
jgi:hypothetical protein